MGTRLFLTGLAVAAVTLTACGGDGDRSPAPSAAAPSPSAVVSATVTVPPPATATLRAPTPTPVPPTATATSRPGDTRTKNTASTLPRGQQATLMAVRYAVHPEDGGFDRVVFEFSDAGLPPATVEVVPRAIACGSGQQVNLRAPGVVTVTMRAAVAHDDNGKATAGPPQGSGKVVKDVQGLCDFEGVVAYALGIDGLKGFTVSTLTSPNRIVVDVNH